MYFVLLFFCISHENLIAIFRGRWLVYCYVPGVCETLDRHETTEVFGKETLLMIYDSVHQKLLDKFKADAQQTYHDKKIAEYKVNVMF